MEGLTEFQKEALETYSHIKRERIDGINYQSWTAPSPPSDMYEVMKKTKIRQSDVIVTGFPRSGNHWAYDVVHMVMNQTTEFAKVPFVKAFWEFQYPDGNEVLEAMEPPRYLGTHARPHRFPSNTLEIRPKMIFLLRNPKDVMISFYKLVLKFTDPQTVYNGTWDQFFELFMMGEYTWGSWFEYVKELEKVMTDHPEVPVHIHQFEKMVEDPVACIKKLCAFLGQPDDLAEDIARVTTFGNMLAKNEQIKTIDVHFFGKTGCLMSQGVIGSWKNTFTVAQSERFNERFEKEMANSKLGALVREYL